MEKVVRVIEPLYNPVAPSFIPTQRKRVAAYARVSTEQEEQANSYEAQIDYYTKHIKAKAEWDFAGIYTDEGISATSTKKRDGFNRMIADALAGKIDLILTKSVSRFARNTVDTLTTVRRLKDKGIEVYFEKENIFTMDSKGELLITIMSSLAQEESRSISENVTWGKRKSFQDGKLIMPYKSFLGYTKGLDDKPIIVPEEAAIVRRIYRLFMEGKTVNTIARLLTKEGIPTPRNKSKWYGSTVKSILTNEKYKGDALLQKTYGVNFLTKERKPNMGELPKYYVEHSHPAIIEPEEWSMVQLEMAKEQRAHQSISPFAGKLICGSCGAFFTEKHWHSTDKYHKVIWQCLDKYKGKVCKTPHLDEEDIKKAFLTAISELLTDRKKLLDDCRHIQEGLMNVPDESPKIKAEMKRLASLARRSIALNATEALDQKYYQKEQEKLEAKHDALAKKLMDIEAKKLERSRRIDAIGAFMFTIMEQEELPIKFDEKLWYNMVENVIVGEDEKLRFKFRNGKEVVV